MGVIYHVYVVAITAQTSKQTKYHPATGLLFNATHMLHHRPSTSPNNIIQQHHHQSISIAISYIIVQYPETDQAIKIRSFRGLRPILPSIQLCPTSLPVNYYQHGPLLITSYAALGKRLGNGSPS